MRIAFYAPMKPPDDPRPSGDRRMGALLMRALSAGGHDVCLASRYSSYDGAGEPAAQRRHRRDGAAIAESLSNPAWEAFAGLPPQIWFTYHLYHKAPDWIGPLAARRLGIPYVIAEASHAPKQAGGRWRIGYGAAAAAIRRADRIVSLNPVDDPCVSALRGWKEGIVRLIPFIEPAVPSVGRARARRDLAQRFGIDPALPWLLTVAMMRPGAKLDSYRLLGAALAQMRGEPLQLIVAGDGPARSEVARLFPRERAAMSGLSADANLAALHAAADLFLWPAVREGYGMALLEAQAAGLPAVAGYTPGVATIVDDGVTGLLTPNGDVAAFAAAATALLADPARRRRMGKSAERNVSQRHDVASAARCLDNMLSLIARNPAA